MAVLCSLEPVPRRAGTISVFWVVRCLTPYWCLLKPFFIQWPSKSTVERDIQMTVSPLFSFSPVWPRWMDVTCLPVPFREVWALHMRIWVTSLTWDLNEVQAHPHEGSRLCLFMPLTSLPTIFPFISLYSPKLDFTVLVLKLLVGSLMVGRKGKAEFLGIHLHGHFPIIKSFQVSVHSKLWAELYSNSWYLCTWAYLETGPLQM